jgi:hypothetical protein
VVDLLDRWQTLVLDYSDFGFLPRELMIRMQDYHRLAIFHLVNGQIWFLNLLFAFHALVALAFVLGYRSRVTTIVLWLLTTSLQGRNDPIGYGIDVVIRISLLWSMFLPLGARFSVDRILSRKAPVSNRYTAFPVLGLFLHVISMYAFTALLKSQSKEWMSGLGTYYALSMDEYVMPVGRILLAHPAAVKFANFSAMFIEGFGWVPLLFSWRKEWFRLPVFLVFLSMHIGMGLCLNVTLFQFGAIAVWTCVLPEAFWTYAAQLSRGVLASRVAGWIGAHWKLAGEAVDEPRRNPGAWNTFAAVLMAVSFYWNLHSLYPAAYPVGWIEPFAQPFGLDQKWDMFAATSPDSGWFVIPAVLRDGTVVDLFKDGGPFTMNKPDSIYASFADERTRKRMIWMVAPNRDDYRMAYGRYLCISWNHDHPEPDKKLDAFKILYLQQLIHADGTKTDPAILMLWKHECQSGMLEKWKSKLEMM